jgi:hypothetical protein
MAFLMMTGEVLVPCGCLEWNSMFNLFDDEPTRQGQGVVLVFDSKMKMHSKGEV